MAGLGHIRSITSIVKKCSVVTGIIYSAEDLKKSSLKLLQPKIIQLFTKCSLTFVFFVIIGQDK